MASLETRITNLEQKRPGPALAIIVVEDGDEERAAAEYLAGIPEAQKPEHVVVIRTFCRPQAATVLRGAEQ